jgi:hypothetical protein
LERFEKHLIFSMGVFASCYPLITVTGLPTYYNSSTDFKTKDSDNLSINYIDDKKINETVVRKKKWDWNEKIKNW